MKRIGRWGALGVSVLALSALASPALGKVSFYQTADRDEVGLEDTFQLTIVAKNAPSGAQLHLPSSSDFEILNKFQSHEQSFSLGPSGAQMTQTEKYVLVMRALRTGNLKVPPAELVTPDRSYRTDPVSIRVVRGHRANPNARRARPANPFAGFGGFPQMPRMGNPFGGMFGQARIPRSDSDLFIRETVTPQVLWEGQQATYSIYIYSRVDLSSVGAVTMPKLDGFWSKDIDSPTQLSAEERMLHGIPYKAYLLRRKALFPVKSGSIPIDPAEADITTGFLFSGRQVHRKSNALTVVVRPLPEGAPKGFSPSNVGRWKLSSDASASTVPLGEPLTITVTLSGRGNLQDVVLPELEVPAAFKRYDPTTKDTPSIRHGLVGGRRVQKWLVVPQQTGTFTLPGLSMPYFDPDAGRYRVATTQPITVHVVPSANGAAVASGSGTAGSGAGSGPGNAGASSSGPKNVLAANGLHPLRFDAHFESPKGPLWQAPFFWPTALAPLGLWLALGLVGVVKERWGREDEGSRHKKMAKAARAHLAAAQQLQKEGSSQDFYGELERALHRFLAAKLHQPVSGLTRESLGAKLEEAKVAQGIRARIRRVLELCEAGRFAPGAEPEERAAALDGAAEVIDRWGAR